MGQGFAMCKTTPVFAQRLVFSAAVLPSSSMKYKFLLCFFFFFLSVTIPLKYFYAPLRF